MYSNIVQWRAEPGQIVSATLMSETAVEAAAETRADATGGVEFTLLSTAARGDPPTDPWIRPGYTITLRSGDLAVEATVPDFAADISASADSVNVIGPAGRTVDLAIEYFSGELWTESLLASGPDVVSLDLPTALSKRDRGLARMEAVPGQVFLARFRPLNVEVQLIRSRVSINATAGSHFGIVVSTAEGQIRRAFDLEIKLSRASLERSLATPVNGISPGDLISVTSTSRVDSVQQSFGLIVPPISVAIQRSTNTVVGVAPPQATLEVVLTSPDHATFSHLVTAMADGTFALSADSVGQLGSGWTAEARHDMHAPFTVASMDVVPQLKVWVGTTQVEGLVRPGREVTLTLFSASEEPLLTRRAWGSTEGTFSLALDDVDVDGYHVDYPAEPGMILEIDDGLGDALIARIPDIAVWSDPDSEQVAGTAPPGGRLVATTPTSSVKYTDTVTADGAGEFAIDYSGRLDIEPSHYGAVTLVGSDGHRYVVTWAPIGTAVQIGTGQVSGDGPPGRRVTVVLRDTDGAVVASDTHSTSVDPRRTSRWTARMEDLLGQQVRIRSGDTIVIDAGDEHAEIEVPQLSGVVHLEEQVLAGSGPPNAELGMEISRYGEPTQSVTVTTGSDGLFTHTLSEPALRFNDRIEALLVAGRHRFSRDLVVPGLTLDMFAMSLRGNTEPLKTVTVTRRRAQLEQLLGSATSSETGGFRVTLVEAGDLIATLVPGDEIIARTDTSDLVPDLIMDVPELVIRPDVQEEVVRGRATPGGRLRIFVGDIIRRFDQWTSRPIWDVAEFSVEAPGDFEVSSSQAFDVRPAQFVTGRYRLPAGHLVTDEEATPLLQVQDGGSNVCGTGLRGSVVEIEANTADGKPLGEGRAVVGRNGWYSTRLEDEDGSEVRMEEGVTVVARIDGLEHQLTIQPLTVSVDWDDGEIYGEGPPNAEFAIEYPVRTCIGEIADPRVNWWTLVGEARSDGTFSHPISSWDRSEASGGIQVGIWTPDGHRFYRQVARSVTFTHVGSDLIEGSATPLTAASAVLRSADGDELARAENVVDSDGAFSLRLVSPGGEPVSIVAGQTIEIEASGETTVVAVEELSFDFSAANGLVGRAAPGKAVTVVIRPTGFGPIRVDITADAEGRFEIRPQDLSPRSHWTFAEIEQVRLEALAPGLRRHYLVADLLISAEEERTIYLPWSHAGP